MKYFIVAFVFLINTTVPTTTKISPEITYNFDKNDIANAIVKTDGDFDALKISFDIDADLDTFISVINDVQNYKTWVFRCLDSKELPGDDFGSIYYQNTFDFPFPFEDRQLTVENI